MFLISVPKSFQVGDTVDCRIDATPQRLTWRDANALVIEPDDIRTIVTYVIEGDLICFVCGDKSEGTDNYDVVPDFFRQFRGGAQGTLSKAAQPSTLQDATQATARHGCYFNAWASSERTMAQGTTPSVARCTLAMPTLRPFDDRHVTRGASASSQTA